MRVKTFHGMSSSSVMEQIRKEMGDEAVILSNKTIKKDGKRYYEIMAAVEAEPSAPKQPGKQEEKQHAPESWQKIHQDWQELKEHFFAVMRPQMDMSLLAPRQRIVLEYLEKEGVTPSVITGIWQHMRSCPHEKTLALLKSIVRVKPWTAKVWPEKFHVLAGPFGTGKTTTALRMALELKQENPDIRICLANADNGKGRLFMRHYADLSGFQYKEIFDFESMRELMRTSQNFDRVIIDTQGYSERREFLAWLQEAQNLDDHIQVHLVMNPLYSSRQTQNFMHRFQDSSVASLIWTKIDEASSYGEIINQSQATGLPVSLLTNGPGLKHNLIKADLAQLWRLIFKHETTLPAIS